MRVSLIFGDFFIRTYPISALYDSYPFALLSFVSSYSRSRRTARALISSLLSASKIVRVTLKQKLFQRISIVRKTDFPNMF